MPRARRSRPSGSRTSRCSKGNRLTRSRFFQPPSKPIERRRTSTGAATKTIALAEAQSSLNQLPSAVKTIDDALKISTEVQILVPAVRILLRAGEDVRARSLDRQARREPAAAIARLRADARGGTLDCARPARATPWKRSPTRGNAQTSGSCGSPPAWPTSASITTSRRPTSLKACTKRIGEATAVFLDDVPTFRYSVAARDWLKRARQGGVSAKGGG